LDAPSPGALQVLVPGSSVSLIDVNIRNAHRYGIYQRGGEIDLRSVTVRETRRDTGQMEYGTGILLQDGVQAFMSTVTSNDNESSGIILRGRGSNLSGTDIILQRNKLHTDFYSEAVRNLELPKGAFLVCDQAVANISHLYMYENEYISLGVYNNAEVTLENTGITYSRWIHLAEADLEPGEGGPFRPNDWGGLGILAKNGGHITMQNFLISHCDLVGVTIGHLGEVDLHEGWVSFNIIGAHLLESYDIERLSDRVAYFENESDLQADAGLPLPSTGIPDMGD
jgi:hypothetical protein